MSSIRYPIVGIPCDVIRNGMHPFHGVGEKYINAVANGAHACPLLIPAQGPGEDMESWREKQTIERLLETIDGLFLPGSPSNIQPHLYSQEQSLTPDTHDPQRDNITLPLINAALARKIPILAVCRGMQELNVALGGTLHQRVHEIPGMMDHRENKSLPREEQYQDAHEVRLTSGGRLATLVNSESIRVNSLHGQGMNRLGKGLVEEAYAPDGLVEAFRLEDASHFVIGVQWHPEWRFRENRFSSALFNAFGQALRDTER